MPDPTTSELRSITCSCCMGRCPLPTGHSWPNECGDTSDGRWGIDRMGRFLKCMRTRSRHTHRQASHLSEQGTLLDPLRRRELWPLYFAWSVCLSPPCWRCLGRWQKVRPACPFSLFLENHCPMPYCSMHLLPGRQRASPSDRCPPIWPSKRSGCSSCGKRYHVILH